MTNSVDEKFIQLSLARTRYLEIGSGEPLILLHGMGIGNSADSFAPLIGELAAHFHVYAVDMLGFGGGDRVIPDGPTFPQVIDHIREFMDALQIKSARFVGHSLGGWIAALLAYESPQRVERLVMLCAAGLNRQPAAGIKLKKIPTADQIRTGLGSMMIDPSAVDEQLFNACIESHLTMLSQPGALTSLNPLLQQMETPEVREAYMLHSRLNKITQPTLVAWGEGDAMDPYPTWTGEYTELNGDMSRSEKPWVIPGAQYRLLPTGHLPQLEAPDLTTKVLLEFL